MACWLDKEEGMKMYWTDPRAAAKAAMWESCIECMSWDRPVCWLDDETLNEQRKGGHA